MRTYKLNLLYPNYTVHKVIALFQCFYVDSEIEMVTSVFRPKNCHNTGLHIKITIIKPNLKGGVCQMYLLTKDNEFLKHCVYI